MRWQISLVVLFLLLCFFGSSNPTAQTTSATGKYNLHFGGQQIATAPLSEKLNLGNQFTLEAWVYLEDFSPFGSIIGKLSRDPNGRDPFLTYALSFDQTGSRVQFLQSNGQAGSLRSASALETFPLRKWTHVAATLGDELDSKVIKLFIDFEEVASETSPGPPDERGIPLVLGGRFIPGPGVAFGGVKGAISQVRVWNIALRSSQLRANSTQQLTATETGLVAYWPLDDGIGTIARDLTPNRLDLKFGSNITSNSSDFPKWIHQNVLENGAFFRLEQLLLLPNTTKEFCLIDFDNDSDLDVIVANYNFPDRPGKLQALRNDGLGNFFDVTSDVLAGLNLTVYPSDLAVFDANGDGRQDLFIADIGNETSNSLGGQSRILIQGVDGRLRDETPSRLPKETIFPRMVSLGDIDNDGDLDLYLCNTFSQKPIGPRFYLNDKNGNFTVNTSRLPGSLTQLKRAFSASRLVDVNGDGSLDLVLGYGGGKPLARDVILLNDGKGRFEFAPISAMPPRIGGADLFTLDIASADFNGDNRPDLIMSVTSQFKESKLQLLINNGNGTFRDATDQIAENLPSATQVRGNYFAKRVITADFNNDGRIDFLVRSVGLATRLYLNTGDANFINADEVLPVGTPVNQLFIPVLAADLDLDKSIDLFFIGYESYFIARNIKPFIVEDNLGFSLSISPDDQVIKSGDSIALSLKAKAFASFQPINISTSLVSAPNGITVEPSTSQIVPGQTATITVKTMPGIPASSFTLNITGSSTIFQQKISANLAVK